MTANLLRTFVFALAILSRNAFGDEGSKVANRRYHVDIQLFSMVPGEGPDSYRGYGGGAAGGPSATVGLRVNDEREFSIEVQTTVRSREFTAAVQVQPDTLDKRTKAMNRMIELSDLEPHSIEIVRNDDGRVYRLQLFPRIEEIPKPIQLDVEALRLDYLSFPNSTVILNDQDYLGSLGMAAGPFATIDIPGLAKIEFSLIPFRKAEPLGKLEDGVIAITGEDGTSLRILDVIIGRHHEQLAGGPYQVFVRWSEPSMTEEEYRKELSVRIATLREQIESGELPTAKNWLQRLEHAQNSGRIMMMTGSLGPIPERDQIDEE